MVTEKESFVYCWTDHKNNMLYVGRHKGLPTDGYITSSNYFNKEHKLRPNDFTRQIIALGSWNDIVILERKILEAANAAPNPLFYNKHNAGWNFYSKGPVTEEHKRKLSIANKGKPNAKKGIKLSQETKNKISVAKKGKQIPWNKGKKTGYKNYTFKKFTIKTPSGEIINITNMKQFCIDNNLSYYGLYQTKKDNYSHKGYRIL